MAKSTKQYVSIKEISRRTNIFSYRQLINKLSRSEFAKFRGYKGKIILYRLDEELFKKLEEMRNGNKHSM